MKPNMKSGSRYLLAAALLAAGMGGAAAQTGPATEPDRRGVVAPSAQLQLTPEQKAAILEAVRQDKAKIVGPAGVPLAVGAQLPAALELRILPDAALAQAPDAKAVQYTVIANRVVLVDPTTMRVVDVLGQ